MPSGEERARAAIVPRGAELAGTGANGNPAYCPNARLPLPAAVKMRAREPRGDVALDTKRKVRVKEQAIKRPLPLTARAVGDTRVVWGSEATMPSDCGVRVLFAKY